MYIDLSTFAEVSSVDGVDSWIWIEQQSMDVDFEYLWNLHPEQRGLIKIMGKEIETPRWQQSYGRDYRFSGMNHPALLIPEYLQAFVDCATQVVGVQYNSALLNWYKDGKDYIGAHSDDEKNLSGDPIFSWTLYPNCGVGVVPRIFRIKNKTTKQRYDIKLQHGTLVIMGGKCQSTHTHEVIKVRKQDYKDANIQEHLAGDQRRINITTRVFNK